MSKMNRIGFLGGSDAAAALGMDKWTTPVDLWMEKTGQGKRREHDDEDNLPQEIGRDMEAWVARKFSERNNCKIRRLNRRLARPGVDWMVGHIDRKIQGQPVGVEIKVTQRWEEWGKNPDRFPVPYYLQCLHYMAVSGYRKWFLVALILNGKRSTIVQYEINPRPAVLTNLVEREQAFWTHVEEHTPPPPRTQEDLNRLYPAGHLDESAYAGTELAEAVAKLRTTKAEIKALKETEEALGFQIKGFLKNATELYDPRGKTLLATWRKNKDTVKTNWYTVARYYALNQAIDMMEDPNEKPGESLIEKCLDIAAEESKAVKTVTGARPLLLKGVQK